MRRLILIFGLLLFIPVASSAEALELVCTDATDFSVNFTVDISQKSVISNGVVAHNVLIDRGTIVFTLDFPEAKFFHVINRSTGNMTVYYPGMAKTEIYKCVKAKPKF